MGRLVFPDYNNCILNLTASFCNYYGVETDYGTLPLVDQALKNKPKHVMHMIFDGMGVDVIEKLLPEEAFLRRKMAGKITSVVPCTTTAAMTSYYSAKSPNEHGWLGWSLYFKEFNGIIDTFLNKYTFHGCEAGKIYAADRMMPYESTFARIEQSISGLVEIHTVFPSGIRFSKEGHINHVVEDLEEMETVLDDLLTSDKENFITVYWYYPDSSMHHHGCYSEQTKAVVQEIDAMVSSLSRHKDVLMVVSADHGLTDVTEEIYLNEYADLDACLVMPPSVETRLASFFVHSEMQEQFVELFNAYFGDSFLLLSREEFFNTGYLGPGNRHKKTNDFIGDFVAIGTAGKIIRYRTVNMSVNPAFKAQHAGLTEAEMVVPLIINYSGSFGEEQS